ncbi:MAG: hypothetical protein M1820_001984 [Bogoriella megaspora]|nr:MAG: hypothetical protein M1820_001984 [Bogoriella megaspora]
MAPKRRPPAHSSSSTANPPTKKRASKLAKENNISASEEASIKEAFSLFSISHDDYPEEKEGVLPTQDVRRCLIALNIQPSPSALTEIKSTLDPTSTGYATYPHFLAIAAIHLRTQSQSAEDVSQEIDTAFRLFTRGHGDTIRITDLRRVARELREDVGDDVLRDMILEANGGEGLERGVGREGFEGVMRRAGVFG